MQIYLLNDKFTIRRSAAAALPWQNYTRGGGIHFQNIQRYMHSAAAWNKTIGSQTCRVL